MSLWVVDTSPLVFLAKLDRLELLRNSADEILLPPAVLDEVRGHEDVASSMIHDATGSWLNVKAAESRRIVEVLKPAIGPGEAEALALAQEVRADRIVLDDLDARRHARRLGVSPVGTLGLLLGARLRGELPSVKEEIQRLGDLGFYASGTLVDAILKAADE